MIETNQIAVNRRLHKYLHALAFEETREVEGRRRHPAALDLETGSLEGDFDVRLIVEVRARVALTGPGTIRRLA